MDLREIDMLVAEKVMGCEVDVHGPVPSCGCPREADFPFGFPHGSGRGEYATDLKHYSADIAAAWQVVDRWQGDKQPLSAPTINLRRTAGGQWECAMLDIGAGRDLAALSPITAATAPLAICLAALKAVGAEVPA